MESWPWTCNICEAIRKQEHPNQPRAGALGSLTECPPGIHILFDFLTSLARERSVRSPNVHRTFAPTGT
jgi:hypothetical protein